MKLHKFPPDSRHLRAQRPYASEETAVGGGGNMAEGERSQPSRQRRRRINKYLRERTDLRLITAVIEMEITP